ncbi:hypothetical protein OIV83_003769 [Microbotryomycetes sp. JL201]|nr:hypothetical protein OIV83_003769 [Microbotryomycetes sp. JL201]
MSAPRYHYCRTPIATDTDSSAALKPIDRISLQQLLQSSVHDLFGPMGGSCTSLDVDIVTVDEPTGDIQARASQSSLHGLRGENDETRSAVVRVPSKAASNVMTAFTFGRMTFDGQLYRIQVVAHGDKLADLSGIAGHGSYGFEQWTREMLHPSG